MASDSRREVSTPDISTGNTSSAAKLKLPSDTEQVQRGEGHQIDTDGGQPLATALQRAVLRLRLRQRAEARQQPQA